MGVPGPHHTSILSIPLAYIWVNYSYSLTWHVGPFWLDSSYWPWFQWGRTGFGRYNLPRYIILGFAHVIQHFSHHSHRVQFLKMRNSTCPLAGTFTVIVRKPVTGPSWRKARWFAEHLFSSCSTENQRSASVFWEDHRKSSNVMFTLTKHSQMLHVCNIYLHLHPKKNKCR